MWAVSAYDDDNNTLLSFTDIESEEDLQDLMQTILAGFAKKPVRLLEIERMCSYD